MTFSRISIVVVATVLVVYFGLTLIFPHHKFEPKLVGGPTPTEVFSSTLSATSSAASSTAPAPADGGATQSIPNTTEAAPASSGEKTLTEAEARKIAEDVGRKVATQVATQLLQQQGKTANAAAPAVSDADVSRIAQAEVHKAVDDQPAATAPAETVAPASSKASRKAAADEKRAEKKAEKAQRIAAAKAARAQAKPPAETQPRAESKHSEPSAETNTAWWAAANGADSGLGLSFAGEAASQRAIALLFNSPLSDAADAGSHITVTNSAGKPEKGPWSLAQNPRMLLLHVAAPGRYAVKVSADLADSQGKKLGVTVQGPVFVH